MGTTVDGFNFTGPEALAGWMAHAPGVCVVTRTARSGNHEPVYVGVVGPQAVPPALPGTLLVYFHPMPEATVAEREALAAHLIQRFAPAFNRAG